MESLVQEFLIVGIDRLFNPQGLFSVFMSKAVSSKQPISGSPVILAHEPWHSTMEQKEGLRMLRHHLWLSPGIKLLKCD